MRRSVRILSTLALAGATVVLNPLTSAGLGAAAADAPPALPGVDVGGFPTGIAADPAMNTVYVGDGGSQVAMINTETCNGTVSKGCAVVTLIPSGGYDALGVAVDQATQTLYVVNANSNTVAMIDAATCNAVVTTGCQPVPWRIPVTGSPEFLAVDEQTDTIYVAGTGSDGDDVSVINGALCNRTNVSGCHTKPVSFNVGASPFPIAVNPANNTVYVGLIGPFTRGTAAVSALAVVNGATCNAEHSAACAQSVTVARVGAIPAGIAIDPANNAVYVSSESGQLAVLGGNCDGAVHAGCPHPTMVRSLPQDLRGDAVDGSTGTLYVTEGGSDSVDAINLAKCSVASTTSCGSGATFVTGGSPRRFALDAGIHTLYVVNTGEGTISVVNTSTCNATTQKGC